MASVAHAVVVYLAWLLCAIYCTIPLFWISIHPLANHWRARGRSAYRILLPLWGVYSVVALLATWPSLHRFLYGHWLSYIFGATLICLGLFIYSRAFPSFTRVQVSGLPELEPERHRQQLMTSGIRARVRHPIYLGHFLEVAGWTVASGSLGLYALLGFAIVTGLIMLYMEDAELEERFGPEYTRYRQSVPAIIPKLF
jgi:protein-S-isoprenylcysteine O-methyltransferase Ste14